MKSVVPAGAHRAGQGARLRPGRRPTWRARPRSRRTASTTEIGARRGGDRRHHELHQHLEPVGDARRRPAGQKAVERGLSVPPLREDQPGPRLEGGDRVPDAVGPACRTSRRSASTWSATAAPPASATAARCPTRSRKAVNDGKLVAAAVLSGNRNFEGRINPRREGQLPGLAAAGGGLRAGRHAPTSTSPPSRSARARDGKPVYLRDIWPTPGGGGRRSRRSIDERDVPPDLRQRLRRQPDLERDRRCRRATSSTSSDGLDLHPGAAVLPGPHRWTPPPLQRHRGRARAGAARRLRHHRPHLARRRHRRGQPGRRAT